MDFVLERTSPTFFKQIEIADLKVSIQASAFHYCSPRKDMPSSDDYESFEVALLLNDKWFHPERDERFANCEWASYWENDDVAGGVPRNMVAQMLNDIRAAFFN